MKLAVLVHRERQEAVGVAAALKAAADDHGIVLGEVDDPDVDVLVAVGGDGTVLQAARRALASGAAVLGVNVGHIGYLAAADPEEVSRLAGVLAAGSYEISTRMTLTATWPDGAATGLNDIVVEKVISQHAVRIALDVDDRHFATYRCDGLVIATPTGSTAYAFSAGGPMLDPELEGLVVTPVAAHNFFAPTIVLPATARLRCEGRGSRRVRVNADGREVAELASGVPVEIQRGERPVRFVVPWPRPFDQVVREKFRLDDDD